jgi:methionyl-tRNA formyltransferase
MLKKITLIISDARHPINSWVEGWVGERPEGQVAEIVRASAQAKGGDICFLISCTEILPIEFMQRYTHVLVIHASDLPKGRGWSPHIWAIIQGQEELTVTLLEASEKVDCGDIWHKSTHQIPKYFLYNDIIEVVNQAHVDLIDYAVEHHATVDPLPQDLHIASTYLPKRTPGDSEMLVSESIASQFDLLRVCDNNRFPSFFHMHGKKFKITIESSDE